MVEVLVFVGGLAAVGTTTAGAVTLLAYRAARRSVRLPNGPAVPVRWRAVPNASARLHRRLAHVVRVADAVAPRPRRRSRHTSDGPVADLAGELRASAVELDRHVVWANQLSGSMKMARIRELATSVGQLEQAARDVAAMAAPTDVAPAVHALASRARLLAESARELDRL